MVGILTFEKRQFDNGRLCCSQSAVECKNTEYDRRLFWRNKGVVKQFWVVWCNFFNLTILWLQHLSDHIQHFVSGKYTQNDEDVILSILLVVCARPKPKKFYELEPANYWIDLHQRNDIDIWCTAVFRIRKCIPTTVGGKYPNVTSNIITFHFLFIKHPNYLSWFFLTT